MDQVAYDAWCDAMREISGFVDKFVRPLANVGDEPCRTQARRCLKRYAALGDASRIVWADWVRERDAALLAEREEIIAEIGRCIQEFNVEGIDAHIRDNILSDIRYRNIEVKL